MSTTIFEPFETIGETLLITDALGIAPNSIFGGSICIFVHPTNINIKMYSSFFILIKVIISG
jgi:hypothetical protein